MAENAKAECKDQQDCHPSVAFVTLAGEDGVINCTGFLISENRLVTNGHCLDEARNILHKGCAGQLWAHFPETPDLPAETIECVKVLRHVREKEMQARSDFLVLEMAKPQHARASISVEGAPQNGERVELYTGVRESVIDGKILGRMGHLTCDTAFGTELLPHARDPANDVMTFSNCPIVSGNSGSPILSESGSAYGIIQAILSARAGSALESHLRSQGRLDQLKGMALGTLFACQVGRLFDQPSDFRCVRASSY